MKYLFYFHLDIKLGMYMEERATFDLLLLGVDLTEATRAHRQPSDSCWIGHALVHALRGTGEALVHVPQGTGGALARITQARDVQESKIPARSAIRMRL